jgi:acetoin utilization deacetylase AcuC-like enzyme
LLFFYDPCFKEHRTGVGHLECPARLEALLKALPPHMATHQTEETATDEELLYCHAQKYIDLVKKETLSIQHRELRMLSTGDVIICAQSDFVARRAVSTAFKAIDCIAENKASSIFCALRPPGHHATAFLGMGFCLYNTIALAARYAQTKKGINKVAIIDFDVHHGNGTQEIFYDDPSVFYFSTHQENIYPFTGRSEEIGIEKGIFTTKNIPIKASLEARNIMIATYKNLHQEMAIFKPDLILISAGFDAHKLDPLGGLNLEDADFYLITDFICQIAKKTTTKAVLSILEGGYSLQALESAGRAHLSALYHKLT